MSVRRSEQTDQLDEAFAKAQAKFGSAKKSTEGQIQNRKYKYADLSEIIPAMLPFLNAEGISIRQHPGFEYKQVGEELVPFVTVTTRITYKGQWEESDIAMPAYQRGVFDAQSCGSGLTYASRYGLQGIGVLIREDDDGQAATGRGTHEEAQAVGQAKIEAVKASIAQQRASEELSLFYVPVGKDNYEIIGAESLKKLNKDILRQFWSAAARAVIVPGDKLDDLKFELEKRQTPFSALKPAETKQ